MTDPKYKVRGPDPDDDYFIVEIKGDKELFLDEAFRSEEAAQAANQKLKAAR